MKFNKRNSAFNTTNLAFNINVYINNFVFTIGGRTIDEETKNKIIQKMTRGTTAKRTLARIRKRQIPFTKNLQIIRWFWTFWHKSTQRIKKAKNYNKNKKKWIKDCVLNENVLTLSEHKIRVFYESHSIYLKTNFCFIEGFYFSLKRLSFVSEL